MTTVPDLPTKLTLKNGQPVAVRLIRPEDADLLVELFYHLSEESLRLRFHCDAHNWPPEQVKQLAVDLSNLDPARQAAIIAVVQELAGETIVGVARLAREKASDTDAESAVVVRDDYQNCGLGSALLQLLVMVAQSMQIKRIYAWIMTENTIMLHIIGRAGLPVIHETQAGETRIIVTLPEPGRPFPSPAGDRQNSLYYSTVREKSNRK